MFSNTLFSAAFKRISCFAFLIFRFSCLFLRPGNVKMYNFFRLFKSIQSVFACYRCYSITKNFALLSFILTPISANLLSNLLFFFFYNSFLVLANTFESSAKSEYWWPLLHICLKFPISKVGLIELSVLLISNFCNLLPFQFHYYFDR